MAEYTFKEFQGEYPDDAACLTKLMEINYGGTEIFCPACGVKTHFHMMSKRRAFACQECGHHVYPCAETIFHKSSTKLTIWFFAMYLMTSTRHGVAAKEIERQTGVTYKCAWRICHELRKLMATADDTGPLSGHVESLSQKAVKERMIHRVICDFEDDSGCGRRLTGTRIAKLGVVCRAI
jgi:transposase